MMPEKDKKKNIISDLGQDVQYMAVQSKHSLKSGNLFIHSRIRIRAVQNLLITDLTSK